VLVTDDTFLADDFNIWCQQHLAPHQRPKHYLRSKYLPRTATGKLQRHRLAHWASEHNS
jgi:acyl-coenzyme A synthetase/AMP-(fatty) acid ligase